MLLFLCPLDESIIKSCTYTSGVILLKLCDSKKVLFYLIMLKKNFIFITKLLEGSCGAATNNYFHD